MILQLCPGSKSQSRIFFWGVGTLIFQHLFLSLKLVTFLQDQGDIVVDLTTNFRINGTLTLCVSGDLN